MKETIEALLAEVRREAARAEFPIDEPVYHRSGRDPKDPILFAGSLEAPLCVVGRDLGKDEVAAGEPLIGAAGRLVRLGIVTEWNEPGPGRQKSAESPRLEQALENVLLTNTVPYKPPGNKSYSEAVRERFRPFLERLLGQFWKGDRVITLGTEAFQWFAPYAATAEFRSLRRSEARFDTSFPCRLPVEIGTTVQEKAITIYPLPHPSPLNQRWYSRFPAMLSGRLSAIRRRPPHSTDLESPGGS